MKKSFKRLGISFDEGIVLQHVQENPGSAQDQIAEAMVLDAAAVARSLKSLEQKGYLSRVVDIENQRRKLVNITPAGSELAKQINQTMKIWDNEVFNGLSESAIASLRSSALFFQQRATVINIAALLDAQVSKSE